MQPSYGIINRYGLSSKSNCSKALMKRVEQVNKKISVGNQNRLVVAVRREAREKCDSGFVFNHHTGEIMSCNEDEKILDLEVCRIADNEYPVYEGQLYIGYVCDGKFILPDGVLQGYVNTARESEVRKKREELRNLLCSRFR